MTRNEPNRNCAGVKIQVRIAPRTYIQTYIRHPPLKNYSPRQNFQFCRGQKRTHLKRYFKRSTIPHNLPIFVFVKEERILLLKLHVWIDCLPMILWHLRRLTRTRKQNTQKSSRIFQFFINRGGKLKKLLRIFFKMIYRAMRPKNLLEFLRTF